MRLADTARARKVVRGLDGSLRTQVSRALERFVEGHTRGLNFEKLVGSPDLYSIRASGSIRILLRQIEPDLFEIMDIGTHEVYRRL